jgi:hypothetical protein
MKIRAGLTCSHLFPPVPGTGEVDLFPDLRSTESGNRSRGTGQQVLGTGRTGTGQSDHDEKAHRVRTVNL